jgi:hypothetical protein
MIMMVRRLSLAVSGTLLLFLPAPIQAFTCPVAPFSLAGAEGAVRIAQAWKDAYSQQHCPDLQVAIEGGGWAMGAARVCDNHIIYNSVDIGGMSGLFFDPQATSVDQWSFDCKKSSRKTVLVRILWTVYIDLARDRWWAEISLCPFFVPL